MSIIREIAAAKINLSLQIMGRRHDGYHELLSLVAFADSGDVLWLDTRQPAAVETVGPQAGAIAGANLVQTALDMATAAEPRLKLGKVRLEKHLPVAAGIGGGSSDAGALLRALQQANPQLARSVDWHAIALRLGADVPVCLVARTMWMSGIGEQLDAAAIPALNAVLVTPEAAVPADKTRRVFAALAASGGGGRRASAGGDPERDRRPDVGTYAALIAHVREVGNELLMAATSVVPAIGEAMAALAASPGCDVAQLSGAGPTCFGIFPDKALSEQAADRLQRTRPGWWVRAVTLGGEANRVGAVP